MLGTVDECIADEASKGVVVNDVGVEVDVVTRLPDGLQQLMEDYKDHSELRNALARKLGSNIIL